MSKFFITACPLIQDQSMKILEKLVEGKIKLDIDFPINSEIVALQPIKQKPALLVKCPVTEDQTKSKRTFVFKPLLTEIEENEKQILKYVGTFSILRPKLIQTKLQINPNQSRHQEFEEITINVFEQIKL